ncbi:iron ABC transporter permease, partial [Streptococcus pneumoniae]
NMFKATTEFSLIIDLVGGIYFIYLLIKRRNED